MQDISGTSLAASLAARRPACHKVEVKWNNVDWTDESDYIDDLRVEIEAVNLQRGVAAIGSAISDRAMLHLKNTNQRFTPWNASSPIYSYIRDGGWEGIPIRISLGYENASGNPEYVYVFWGIIDDLSHGVRGQTATIRALDKLGRFIDYQVKTILYENVLISDFAETLRMQIPAAVRPPQVDEGIDKSIFSLPFAWANDGSLMVEWSKLAEAEGGRVYCDHHGRFMFENAVHLATGAHLSSQASFTVSSFAEMQSTYNRRDRARKVVVYYTRPRVGRMRDIWSAPYPHLIKPGETRVIRAEFDTPAREVQIPLAEVDYWAMTYGGTNRTDQVSVDYTIWAQQALLSVTNNDSQELVLSLCKLRGYPIEYHDEESVCLMVDSDGTVHEETDTITETNAGLRPIEIRDNWYIQTPEHAHALAEFIAYRLRYPRQSLTLSNLAAMPWLETGDRVTVTERNGLLSADFYVQKIELTLRGGVLGMNLRLLAADGLFASTNYFRLGTDALGGGKVYFL